MNNIYHISHIYGSAMVVNAPKKSTLFKQNIDIFTELASRPVQSISHNVRLSVVCFMSPLSKTGTNRAEEF